MNTYNSFALIDFDLDSIKSYNWIFQSENQSDNESHMNEVNQNNSEDEDLKRKPMEDYQKKTADSTSQAILKDAPKIKFLTKKTTIEMPQRRFDGSIKYIKTKISKFAKKKLQALLKRSDLPIEIRSKKISSIDSKLFTSIPSMKKNYEFLNMKIADIFCFGKDENKKRRDNHEIISKINQFFDNNYLSPSSLELKNFLALTYEGLIREFYQSEEFQILKNEEKALYHEEGIRMQEKISILEKNGLIDLIKKKSDFYD